MPTKWMKWMREEGQLKVHNMGGSWSAAVDKAIITFNNLGFGVKLVPEREKHKAQIVVKLSNGAEVFEHIDDKIIVDFPADGMHGRARTITHPKRKEIYFAGVFLPGKVQNVMPKQKEVMIVHELIHACGLDGGLPDGGQDPKQDHEENGIMASKMAIAGDGLIEYFHELNTPPMTPIRVGPLTMCKMRMLWAAGENCKED